MLSNRPSAEAAHNNNTASPSPHRVGSAAPKSDDASITRISRACERCRRRKIRCNGAQPCTGCSRQPTACDYRTGHSRVRTRRNQQPSASARNGPRDPSPDHPAPISTSEQPAPKPKVPGRSWYNRCCVGIRISNHLTSTFQVYGPSSQIAFLQRVYERLVMCQFPGSEDSEQEIPTAIRNWRLERFLFSMPRASLSEPSSGAVLPRHLGDLFIRSYFKLVHPQLPILDYQKVVSQWVASWEAHDVMDENSALRHQGKEIMFMAIAVGARVCPIINQDGFRLAEAWAEHFSQRVEIPFSALEEPSLHVVRVFLLKAIYAQHVIRTNDAYMYLGHAARTATALGMDRSFGLGDHGTDALEISLTFWSTYIMERMTALMIGRPSNLRDEHIDATYPLDDFVPAGPRHVLPCGVITDWSYIRAMAMLGELADEIFTSIYGSKAASLEVQNFLPTSGILVPALVFVTFFASVTEAQRNTSLPLGQCIELCVGSAKAVIRFTHHSLSSRVPDARSDGSPAIYLVSACLTLLFHVLHPATTAEAAKDTFLVLDQAIQCLGDMKHLGPTTGKRLSLDIMGMAQNVISSRAGQSLIVEDQGLTAEYPWHE
ncbi:hypothetical protein N7516_009620 [Penicillium verrucosum]|uniref:uncharacterized protein n=1 Tax=Penicillium verrucosum TaxID=60171 RepID=UPI0025456BFB|nr:uncharacterized protein N7516_009620 [Penicillium verrucosum]KAJ5921917.1 hypothetical protein N7516_009620 [Penicillium verrucosum]